MTARHVSILRTVFLSLLACSHMFLYTLYKTLYSVETDEKYADFCILTISSTTEVILEWYYFFIFKGAYRLLLKLIQFFLGLAQCMCNKYKAKLFLDHKLTLEKIYFALVAKKNDTFDNLQFQFQMNRTLFRFLCNVSHSHISRELKA